MIKVSVPGNSPEALGEALQQARRERGVVLGLDYDGTLVEIAPRPEMARPGDELLQLLARLTAREDIAVVVVSGRPLRELREWLPLAGLHLMGSHGGEALVGGRVMALTAGLSDEGERQGVAGELTALLTGMAGWWLESKPQGVALHYRQASPKESRRLQAALAPVLARWAGEGRWQVLRGRKVVELVPTGVSKGTGFTALLRLPGFSGRIPVYLGDDVTDESVFAALGERGITIKVGRGEEPTAAAFRLEGPAAVHRLLASLLA